MNPAELRCSRALAECGNDRGSHSKAGPSDDHCLTGPETVRLLVARIEGRAGRTRALCGGRRLRMEHAHSDRCDEEQDSSEHPCIGSAAGSLNFSAQTAHGLSPIAISSLPPPTREIEHRQPGEDQDGTYEGHERQIQVCRGDHGVRVRDTICRTTDLDVRSFPYDPSSARGRRIPCSSCLSYVRGVGRARQPLQPIENPPSAAVPDTTYPCFTQDATDTQTTPAPTAAPTVAPNETAGAGRNTATGSAATGIHGQRGSSGRGDHGPVDAGDRRRADR